MFQILRNAWKIPDVRRKILFTLLILFIYRVGSYIPVPGINIAYVSGEISKYGVLGFMDLITGGNLGNFTIFAMGISPYINASIIMNLLTVAIPPLERMAKEGETGRKKISRITSIVTIALAFIQAVGITLGLGAGAVLDTSWFNYVTIGFCLAAGTALTVWMGERITEKGIGNGISLMIFIGIVSRLPNAVISLFTMTFNNDIDFWSLILIFIVVIAIVVGVVFVDRGVRKVPVQYAKRVVGRKMYGGQSTHIPIKVNSAGVLPIIFASILLSFPGTIAQFWPESAFYRWYQVNMGHSSWLYLVIMGLLILFFTYFYTTISFNPIEISKNMQQYGGFIPGIRPGKPTSDYLARISSRITLFGAVFLAFMAIIPTAFTGLFNLGAGAAFGATSILIMVSVALETSQQLESQMMMRHYKGFLS